MIDDVRASGVPLGEMSMPEERAMWVLTQAKRVAGPFSVAVTLSAAVFFVLAIADWFAPSLGLRRFANLIGSLTIFTILAHLSVVRAALVAASVAGQRILAAAEKLKKAEEAELAYLKSKTPEHTVYVFKKFGVGVEPSASGDGVWVHSDLLFLEGGLRVERSDS